VAVILAWVVSNMTPPAGAGLALFVASLIIFGLIGVSREARAASREALQPYVRGELVDVILMPNPASPMCWGFIGVEAFHAADEYVLWRGTLSLTSSLKPPARCASDRVMPDSHVRTIAHGDVVLREEIRQPLSRLRRAGRDCWTQAWLRFGRAPVIEGDRIFDLRFHDRALREFTQMTLRSTRDARACPSFVPDWEMPRRDLFGR